MNVETLMNCSTAYYYYLLTHLSERGEDYFDLTDMRVQKAGKCIQQLVKIHNTTKSLCLFAMYLVRCQKFVLAEENFLDSIKDDPTNSFALIEYYYFLDQCGLNSAAEHCLRVIEEQTKTKVMSPYRGIELGGVIKVFVENGSFKSLSVTATTTAMDILAQVTYSLKITFDPLRMQLCVVDPGLSVKQMAGDGWKNEVDWENVWETAKRKEILPASSLPFIFLQRPKNTSFLYLRKVSSPLSPIPLSKVVKEQKAQMLPESLVFVRDEIDFITHMLDNTHSEDHLEALLFAAPVIISQENLRNCLGNTCVESAQVMNVLDIWAITHQSDFDRSDLENLCILARSSPLCESLRVLEEKNALAIRIAREEKEIELFLHVSRWLGKLGYLGKGACSLSDSNPFFDLNAYLSVHQVFIFLFCFVLFCRSPLTPPPDSPRIKILLHPPLLPNQKQKKSRNQRPRRTTPRMGNYVTLCHPSQSFSSIFGSSFGEKHAQCDYYGAFV